MTLRDDPITGELRLLAPGRAARLGAGNARCPFCVGNEAVTPHETGRIEARAHVTRAGLMEADWSARAFPNLYPLTDPHEVVVPTPRHVTSWRELTLPELDAGLELIRRRRSALLRGDRYVHAFVNDGTAAGASLPHVHAQLVSVPASQHAARLTRGVRDPAACALCQLLDEDPGGDLVIERGLHHAIVAHPMPRMGGGLLIMPLAHDHDLGGASSGELAALLHRALHALAPDAAVNMWFVADEPHRAHWYVELQPRTANLAGVELALGLSVVAADPLETAASARERLAIRHPAPEH